MSRYILYPEEEKRYTTWGTRHTYTGCFIHARFYSTDICTSL